MTLLSPNHNHAADECIAQIPQHHIPTAEEKVRASERFDKSVLVAAHMAALHDAYIMEMATHPVNEVVIKPSSPTSSIGGLKPSTLKQLKIGKVHRRRVLSGTLCVKTLCTKGHKGFMVVNVLEDEEGNATPIYLSNAMEGNGGSMQAQQMYPQDSKVAVKEPYLTRLPDGEIVLLVEKTTDLVFLWVPEVVKDNGDANEALKDSGSFESGMDPFAVKKTEEGGKEGSKAVYDEKDSDKILEDDVAVEGVKCLKASRELKFENVKEEKAKKGVVEAAEGKDSVHVTEEGTKEVADGGNLVKYLSEGKEEEAKEEEGAADGGNLVKYLSERTEEETKEEEGADDGGNLVKYLSEGKGEEAKEEKGAGKEEEATKQEEGAADGGNLVKYLSEGTEEESKEEEGAADGGNLVKYLSEGKEEEGKEVKVAGKEEEAKEEQEAADGGNLVKYLSESTGEESKEEEGAADGGNLVKYLSKGKEEEGKEEKGAGKEEEAKEEQEAADGGNLVKYLSDGKEEESKEEGAADGGDLAKYLLDGKEKEAKEEEEPADGGNLAKYLSEGTEEETKEEEGAADEGNLEKYLSQGKEEEAKEEEGATAEAARGDISRGLSLEDMLAMRKGEGDGGYIVKDRGADGGILSEASGLKTEVETDVGGAEDEPLKGDLKQGKPSAPPPDVDAGETATSLRVKGNAIFARGDFNKAASVYGHAAEKAHAEGTKTEEILCLSNRAEVWLRLCRNQAASDDAEAALKLLRDHEGMDVGDLTLAKALFRKGRALMGLHKYEDAMRVLQEVLAKAPADRQLREAALKCRNHLQHVLKPGKRQRAAAKRRKSGSFAMQ